MPGNWCVVRMPSGAAHMLHGNKDLSQFKWLFLVWLDKTPSAQSDHCGVMGWRRWVWIGQHGCSPSGRAWCRRCHPRRHAACVTLQPGSDHHCRGRLGDRHTPGGRRLLGPANVGVAEDWGQVVWRIKGDLKWLFKHFALWQSILRIDEIIKGHFPKQTNTI